MASGPSDDLDASDPSSTPAQPTPRALVANSPTAAPAATDAEPGNTSVAGVKREASVVTTDGDDALNKKKKKTGPGSRGVANLTPEQLAKKRANEEPPPSCYQAARLHLPMLLCYPSLFCLLLGYLSSAPVTRR
jgi:hypothetical protein